MTTITMGILGVRTDWLARVKEWHLVLALAGVSFLAHAYNIFRYPLYLGDEGIYMQQAWSLLREGKLSPYTYFYDHAPVGWILIALWTVLLPKGFLTFGMAINSGRMLMLIVHLVSLIMFYRVTKRLAGGSILAAVVATVFFSLSPLSVFYQRMVLLDNVMVFWLLVALYLLLFSRKRLVTILGSGTAFALAVLTKENAIFFGPVFIYVLMIIQTRQSHTARFAKVGWLFAAVAIISVYPLYATLNTELLPDTLAIPGAAPVQHVSLIDTLGWQLGRKSCTIFGDPNDPTCQFWQFFRWTWWTKDPAILVVGVVATAINLVVGLQDRQHRRGQLVAALLSASFILYLTRGSQMLQFYVVPALPFLAMNVGILAAQLHGALPRLISTPLLALAMAVVLLAFAYWARDFYFVQLTHLQSQQLTWIRQHVPPGSTIVTDDDIWVDLHEPNGRLPIFPKAHSHWKVAQDPAVRDRLFAGTWRTVDYLVLSDDLGSTVLPAQGGIPFDAYQHSRVVARFVQGAINLEIRKVDKAS